MRCAESRGDATPPGSRHGRMPCPRSAGPDAGAAGRHHQLRIVAGLPDVGRTASGRPQPSAARWIFVLSPPRERPNASPAPAVALAPPLPPRRVLVRPHDHRVPMIVHSTGRPSSWTCAAARVRSHVPSAVHRRSRSWQVFHGPYRSGRSRRAHLPQDPVDHLTVINDPAPNGFPAPAATARSPPSLVRHLTTANQRHIIGEPHPRSVGQT